MGLSLAAHAPAQNSGDVRSGDLDKKISAIARPLGADGLLSGSLAVGHRDAIVHRSSYGMANYELSAPNRTSTRFCIASVSKPITALAVARLIVAGRLDPDATVSTWIQGFPRGGEITLMHLLRHSAGIPHRVTTPSEETVPIDAAEIVSRIKKRGESGLLFRPGERRSYTTAGYSVIARIIEIVTDKDYDAAMRELIFAPLGMTSTCHVDSRVVLPGRAQCYLHGVAGMRNALLSDLSFLVGGGSLYSTAEDLVRLGLAAIHRRGLPKGTWKVFRERLGWMRSNVVRWNGKTNQFGAFLDLHVDAGIVVAFTGNTGVAGGAMLRAAVPKLIAGEEVAPPARLSKERLTEQAAARYLGHYVRNRHIRTEVTLNRGILQTGRGGLLFQMTAGRFFSPTYGCDVTFDLTASGAVKALVYRPLDKAPIVFRKTGR